jgi:hypothetical protein
MSLGVDVVIGKRIRTSQTLPNREVLLRFDTRYAIAVIPTLNPAPAYVPRIFFETCPALVRAYRTVRTFQRLGT